MTSPQTTFVVWFSDNVSHRQQLPFRISVTAARSYMRHQSTWTWNILWRRLTISRAPNVSGGIRTYST